MKALILYHLQSEEARVLEDYAHDFSSRTNKTIKLVSLETRQGADIAKLYDIVRYPALLVADDTGHLQQLWQGLPLPLMDELDGYLVA